MKRKGQPPNSRRKGIRAELEVARIVSKWLGVEVKRNLVQARERGQEDLTGVEGWLIQVKHRNRLSLDAWWRDLCLEAGERGLLPVLWWRTDGSRWMVRAPCNGVIEEAIDVQPLTWLELVRARAVVASA